MNSNQTETDRVTRRRTLRGIGAGVGLVALGVGSGAADPGNGNGNAPERPDHPHDPWPQYSRTPDNAGHSATEGVRDNVSEKWRFETDHYISGQPMVVDDTVYACCWDKHLYAINANTGEKRWSFKSDYGMQDMPAVVNGIVYCYDAKGYVYALDAGSGEIEWEWGDGDDYGERDASGPPTVADGRVYMGTGWWDSDTGSHHEVIALDADTGDEIWVSSSSHLVNRPTAFADGTIYATTHGEFSREGRESADNGMLHAYDAETGEEQWRHDTGYITFAAPAVVDGSVYIIAGDYTLRSVNAETGDVEWRLGIDADSNEAPAVADGTVYVGTSEFRQEQMRKDDPDNSMYAVDAETGEQLWRTKTGSVYGAPSLVRGTLYFGVGGQEVLALDADTGDYSWIHEPDHGMGSAAVSDGTVYVQGAKREYIPGSGTETSGIVLALEEAEE